LRSTLPTAMPSISSASTLLRAQDLLGELFLGGLGHDPLARIRSPLRNAMRWIAREPWRSRKKPIGTMSRGPDDETARVGRHFMSR
jgi:hypothetical protein